MIGLIPSVPNASAKRVERFSIPLKDAETDHYRILSGRQRVLRPYKKLSTIETKNVSKADLLPCFVSVLGDAVQCVTLVPA